MDNVVFIAGQPRSGTSLLVRLFDGHSQILSLPDETQFFTNMQFYRRFKDDPDQYFLHAVGQERDVVRQAKLHPATFIERGVSWKPLAAWKEILAQSPAPAADEERLKKVIAGTKSEKNIFLELAAIYRDRTWQRQAEPEWVLEKTPGNEYVFEKLRALFPRCRVLHIIRDPFDNWESRIARKGAIRWDKVGARYGIINMLYAWRRSLRLAVAFQKRYPENYCILKYENLVTKPDETMRKVAAFVGVPLEAVLTRPTQNNGQKAWAGATHQATRDSLDRINPAVLEKDAGQTVGRAVFRTAAAFVGRDYHVLQWQKYADRVEHVRGRDLLQRHAQERRRHVVQRMLLYLYFMCDPVPREVHYL